MKLKNGEYEAEGSAMELAEFQKYLKELETIEPSGRPTKKKRKYTKSKKWFKSQKKRYY